MKAVNSAEKLAQVDGHGQPGIVAGDTATAVEKPRP